MRRFLSMDSLDRNNRFLFLQAVLRGGMLCNTYSVLPCCTENKAPVNKHPDPDPLDRKPTWLELESVKPLIEAERITDLSRYTIKREYPQYVVKLSSRREGMKLRHILLITTGKLTKSA